jgi:hypothetical protein
VAALAFVFVLSSWGDDEKGDSTDHDSWTIIAQEKNYELDDTDQYKDYNYKILPYTPPWIDLECDPELHEYSVWSGRVKIENRLDYTGTRRGKEYDIFEFYFGNLVVSGGEGNVSFRVNSIEHYQDLRDGDDSWRSNFTEWNVPGGEVALAIDEEGCSCDIEIDLSRVEVFRPGAQRHDWVTNGVNSGPDYWDVRVMGDYREFEDCVIVGKSQIGFVWKKPYDSGTGELYTTTYDIKIERTDIK